MDSPFISLIAEQVAEDLIWVWPTSGPAEFIAAAAQPPPVTPELAALPADSRVYIVGKPYMRELPYDWQVCPRVLYPVHRVCKIMA